MKRRGRGPSDAGLACAAALVLSCNGELVVDAGVSPIDAMDDLTSGQSDGGIDGLTGDVAADGNLVDGGTLDGDVGDATDAADASSEVAPCQGQVDAEADAPTDGASVAVAYQINPAHTGVQPNDTLTIALMKRWTVTFPGPVSYPLVAGGRVFVTAVGMGSEADLYAVDERTGAPVWGPVDLGSTNWSNAAYENGRVFTVNQLGVVAAWDEATGANVWHVQMTGETVFSSPPTAYGGIVYFGGAGNGGTLYAVDENSGAVVWTAPIQGGGHSSPAVTTAGVFVSYDCNQAYAFNPTSGTLLWHHAGNCSGLGGKSVALYAGDLYTRDVNGDLILCATSGVQMDTYASTPIPAFFGGFAYYLAGSVVSKLALRSSLPQWNNPGDGTFDTAPILVGQLLLEGEGSGYVHAIDTSLGGEVSSDYVGAPIPAPDEQTLLQPLTGMAAADNSLFIPAGNILVAY